MAASDSGAIILGAVLGGGFMRLVVVRVEVNTVATVRGYGRPLSGNSLSRTVAHGDLLDRRLA
jgi:hypothetical protein